MLLGYIVDRVLYGVEPSAAGNAHHHAEAFREQLFRPLGLSTVYEKHLLPGESLGLLPNSYFTLPDGNGGAVRQDVTLWDDAQGSAASMKWRQAPARSPSRSVQSARFSSVPTA